MENITLGQVAAWAAATVSYTIVSREATPRVFALSITPTGDLIFYNYSSAYAGVLPIANVFTYLA